VSFDELLFFCAVLLFSVTTVLCASIYYNRIKRVTSESHEVINGVLVPINTHLKTLEGALSRVLYDNDRTMARVDKIENAVIQREPRRYDDEFLTLDRTTKEITEQISQLRTVQNALQEQIAEIEKRPLLQPMTERRATPLKSTALTKTEKKILDALLTHGPQTAPEIEKAIQKTREHTSRLMKKLWLEGYIEREVHVIPYVYRPTKKFIERVKDVT